MDAERVHLQAKLQGIYDELAERHGFGKAVVIHSMQKLTGGHISYRRVSRMVKEPTPHVEWLHRIVVSGHQGWAEQENTVRHEAAHAMAWDLYREKGHGGMWLRCCELTGAVGSANSAPMTAALRKSRTKYWYRCDGCLVEFGQTFRLSSYKFHRSCGSERGKLRLLKVDGVPVMGRVVKEEEVKPPPAIWINGRDL